MPKNLLLESKETGKEEVVVSEKICHRGSLHLFVENGGVLPLGLFGLKIVRVNETYSCVQIITRGLSDRLKYSVYRGVTKLKKDKDKGKGIKDTKPEEIKQEKLF